MWLTFMTLTFMVDFIRLNEVARFKFNVRQWIMWPLHLLYLIMIVLGLGVYNKDYAAFCEVDTYPRIFKYQYGVFFFTYLVFIFLVS